MNNTFTLDKIIYQFSQEGNTLGTTSEIEELIVTVENQSGNIIKNENFLVIHSNGWSVNSMDEIVDLLIIVKEGVKLK